MKKYLNTIRLPIILAIINRIAGFYLYIHLPGISGDVAFNIVRLGVFAYAGWLMTAVGDYGIWKAALAGFLLLFLDHVIIKGGSFLSEGQWQAFGGVVISFFMFVLIAMVISGIGGYMGKKRINAI